MPKYITDQQVCELAPGLTRAQLANWRYQAKGPNYRKLGRKVVYLESEVIDWIESNARTGTSPEAVSA